MSFNGEFTSMAEAVGDTRWNAWENGESLSPGWVAGIDFDPSDSDEMEIMELVFEREKEDTISRMRRENERLRRELASMRGDW